ncbi:MotA/TolQ/ExbB proton channel family protein [Peristeroidobacter agariperforans]|uniref:MotA/TolQ/ExbB proton channel family protein n=1 Tax=Peristeroidobacter agariperforans TaxID=268404 RepID=UPI00101DD9B2|nr:MotA/TolQ/ExbB proton channel family protein [Peristeroidobacter agariperforans]
MANETQAVPNNFDALSFLNEAGPLAWAILIVLVAMSLACWFITLTRIWDQRKINKDFLEARKKFWTSGNLHDGIAALGARDNVFRMLAEDGLRAKQYHQGHLTEQMPLNEWLAIALQRSMESVTERLSMGLAILATTGSVSPFIGLLGTVWGILNALTRISLSGQPSLDQIAGPIGEALVMTAIGLFVAVPAVMGYNWLIRRNKAIQEKMRLFAADVHSYLVGGARFDTATPVSRVPANRATPIAKTA